MRRKISVCILLLMPAGFLHAQQHLIDSIRNELSQQMPDSNRDMSMMRLAVDYEAIDTAKAYPVKNIEGGSDSEEHCILLTDLGDEKIIYKQRRNSWK